MEQFEKGSIYKDIAIVQFYCGARISEILGLQRECIDHQSKSVLIKYVAMTSRSKKLLGLKQYPKNGQERVCKLPDEVFKIVSKRCKLSKNNFVFSNSVENIPISYRSVQYQFNKALQKAGLGDKFGGTHILRHSAATLARKVTGKLDGAQAITGHKSITEAEKYGALHSDVQAEASQAIFDLLKALE